RGHPIEGVVGVGRDLTLGIGAGEQVAGGIIGVGGGAGIRGDLLVEVVEAVVAVGGHQRPRIGDGGELIHAVVAIGHHPGEGVGDLHQAVQGVVGVDRHIPRAGQGAVDLGDVALVVIGVGGGLAGRANLLNQAVQAVVDAGARVGQDVTGVDHLLLGAVGHRIEGVDVRAAEVVGGLGHAVGVGVGVVEVAAIGQRDLGQLARPIIGIRGEF